MTTIRVAQAVQLLYAKGWGPGCLANTDLVNPVYFGHSQDISTSSDQIPALGAIPVDGSRDIYGSTLASGIVVAVQSMPGVTNWAPSPAQVSAQINALGLAKDTSVNGLPGTIAITGAPPLVFKRVIDVLIGQNIAASGSLTRPASGQFSLNQPGYEIQLNVATLGGTAPIVSVELQWFDSTFGARMDDEIYYFYSGNVNGHFIHGRGPTKGDQVVVIIKNYSATSAIAVSYTLLQTSRVFTREFWKTVGPNATAPVFPGFTAATMNPSSGALADNAASLAASGNTTLILPLYTGMVALMGSTTDATAGNSEWDIIAATDQQIPSAAVLAGRNGQSGFAAAGATSLYLPQLSLPRSQCQLILKNNNTTTTQTLAAVIIAQEARA